VILLIKTLNQNLKLLRI